MILTDKLRWMHLPKTAGTSTERLFIASGVPIIWNDPQSSPMKHLPLNVHPFSAKLPLNNQQPVVNFRRLPYWLLSNLQHKRKMMNLDVPSDPMRKGLFWRHRDQTWLPADWWLERFSVTSDFLFLRVEYLKQDFLKCLQNYHSIGFSNYLRVRFSKAKNSNIYQRNLCDWFSPDDIQQIYKTNPIWATLEQQAYGQLVTPFS